jgi:hypothetical protein
MQAGIDMPFPLFKSTSKDHPCVADAFSHRTRPQHGLVLFYLLEVGSRLNGEDYRNNFTNFVGGTHAGRHGDLLWLV